MKVLHSFSTKRTRIREFTYEDEGGLIELLCNPDVTDNLAFDEETKTVGGAKDLLRMTITSYDTANPMLAYAIEHIRDHAFIGATGLNPLNRDEVEIFYALLPGFWGKGYATEVLYSFSNYIFKNTTFQNIVAFITQNNIASMRVAEKSGYTNYGLVKNTNFEEEVFVYRRERGW